MLEVQPLAKADGILLGKRNGKAVCLPADTRLNRHVAVFGASGTGKSRGFIRPALFNIIQRGESAIITDSKGELYADTAELFRRHGYEVQVFNLVNPEHGDSWNCMSGLGGDTLLAQVLTNVIIGNTSSGKTDHFWDNGEGNLLKALILYGTWTPPAVPRGRTSLRCMKCSSATVPPSSPPCSSGCPWTTLPVDPTGCSPKPATRCVPALCWAWVPGCKCCKTKRWPAFSATAILT